MGKRIEMDLEEKEYLIQECLAGRMLQMGSAPIIRHTRVRANANPYLEPQYFAERKFSHGMKRVSGKFKQIWRNQHGRCYHCGLPMEISDEREIFY